MAHFIHPVGSSVKHEKNIPKPTHKIDRFKIVLEQSYTESVVQFFSKLFLKKNLASNSQILKYFFIKLCEMLWVYTDVIASWLLDFVHSVNFDRSP